MIHQQGLLKFLIIMQKSSIKFNSYALHQVNLLVNKRQKTLLEHPDKDSSMEGLEVTQMEVGSADFGNKTWK